jgi:hypothetical protein
MDINWINQTWQQINRAPFKTLIYLLVVVFIVWIIKPYVTSYFSEKAKKSATPKAMMTDRAFIDIEACDIKFADWTEAERRSDPNIAENCSKIILYFKVHNLNDVPATNVEMNCSSEIIQEKNIGRFWQDDWVNCPYIHRQHVVTDREPARQPFTLGLDKKAIKYFKNGDIKVQLEINVQYRSLGSKKMHHTRKTYVYSPTFENHAEELSSKIE